eukprot:3523164-Prymnesium_polylepis.2
MLEFERPFARARRRSQRGQPRHSHSMLVVIGGAGLALALLLLLCYYLADRETTDAAAVRRGCTTHKTVVLSRGVTAYVDQGPRDGTPILLVHGLSVGWIAYEAYHGPFLAAGFRVLSFDGYGRGFSDRVDERRGAPLDVAALVCQVEELLDHLGVKRVVLYGVSLGAAISARFAATHPERVLAVGFQCPLVEAPPNPVLALANVLAKVRSSFARRKGDR